MNATVMTLARYYALKEVKASIALNEGYRGSQGLEIAELKMRARAFLDNHPEIIARAAKTVRMIRHCAGWPNDTTVCRRHRSSAPRDDRTPRCRSGSECSATTFRD